MRQKTFGRRTKPIVGGADLPVCSAIEGRAWMVVLVPCSGIFLCLFFFKLTPTSLI